MVTARSVPRAYTHPLIAFDSPSLGIAASSRVPTMSDAPIDQNKHDEAITEECKKQDETNKTLYTLRYESIALYSPSSQVLADSGNASAKTWNFVNGKFRSLATSVR